MKRLIIALLYILGNMPDLYSQERIEVYISSNDCVKCTSVLNEIIRFCSSNKINYNIFTDYKTNKQRILKDFNEIPDSLIICDKTFVNKVIPNNASAIIYRDGNGTDLKQNFSELDLMKILDLREKYLNPSKTYHIVDSIFENNNFETTHDRNLFLLFQKQLQLLLTIEIKNDTIRSGYTEMTTSKDAFSKLSKVVELKRKLELMPYDSTIILNKSVKLPLQNVMSINLDGRNVISYKSVYFYFKEKSGGLGNKGFVFLNKASLNNDYQLVNQNDILVEPVMLPDSILIGFYIFYKNQKLNNGRYFAFYGLYNDKENRNKIENRYLGGIYSIQDSNIVIEKNYKIGKVNLSDSLQMELRKYAFGNSPIYFSLQESGFVLYKNFSMVLDLQTGSYIELRQFLKNYTHFDWESDINFIFDFKITPSGYILVYTDKKQPSVLYCAKFSIENGFKRVKLNEKLGFDYLNIVENGIVILRKLDDEKMIEIKKFEID